MFDLRTALPAVTGMRPVAHFAPTHSDGQHWDVVLRAGYIDTRTWTSARTHLTVQCDGFVLGDPTFTSTG